MVHILSTDATLIMATLAITTYGTPTTLSINAWCPLWERNSILQYNVVVYDYDSPTPDDYLGTWTKTLDVQ